MSVETPEYAAMLKRMIRSYGKRVAEEDYVDLADMLEVRAELEAAIAHAVREQQARTSWSTVALGLGVTREAAFQRYRTRKEPSSATTGA